MDMTATPRPQDHAEDRNRQLILHMPIALWQVDSRSAGQAFEALRAEGVSDIAAYLDTHPALVEQAKDTVVVTEANLAAMALFRGRSRQALLRPVRYLFAGTPDMAKRVMVSHFRGDRSYREQAQIVAFDGSVRDVVFSVTYPTPSEDQDNTFILIEDITEQRRTEVQLRRLEAEYSHAARVSTLGELATSIAHEVKQPLSAIITNAETSLRWLNRAAPNVEKLVQLNARILQSATRANDIILRIQAMAARHASTRAPVEIGELIRESLLFVRHEIESRSVDLAVGVGQDGAVVIGDRVELQQVIVNLLVNAIQAVAPLPLDRRRVWVTAQRLGQTQVVVHVRDSGPGIEAAVLPRLFEGFFTTKEGGMGMGLAICQSLIEAHDGTITAANDSEGGAVFEVRLPLAR
jgi:C4-dicarboxylate-specific signal transduction histidine kinase